MADIELESEVLASPPTEVVAPTPVPVVSEEDDIMAGTALSEQEQKDAEAASVAVPPPPAASTSTSTPEERRKRAAGGLDDKKRAKRLFGGLLGTLDAFKKEERQRGASDAAKRRSLITDRIQNKLRTESHVMTDIATKEREIRVLRFELDKFENEFVQKSAAYTSRHASLPRLASFLHTTVPKPLELALATDGRRNPLPLLPPPSSSSAPTTSFPPLGQAAFHKVGDKTPRALFYLPAVLLPAQEVKLEEQKVQAEQVDREEQEAWAAKKEELRVLIRELKTKEPLLQTELASLRKQKLELDAASNPTHSGIFSSSNTNSNAAYPAPSNFAPPTTTNGAVVEQKEEKMEEEPVGDGMMDVEGDEDVEY
ncbi:hypothetical protein BDY24DRAFT_389154 [Mrakia frigida]|uniref:uncharacterized protein n=1 Tax=Mrakia frigida TaxID=29902 RepID=UPI003FCC0F46